MALDTLGALDKYKITPFAPGTPESVRTFYSPVDDIHHVLLDLIGSASRSLSVAMYGFDDQEFSDALLEKLNAEHVFVQLTLDSSQAGGAKEKGILATADFPANSISVGRSEHGAIMHMKMLIVDGIDVVTGSTNWSAGGETKQDNQLTVVRDALVATEARTRIDVIHTTQLQQMAARAATEGS